jgi:hypothetical protein
MTEMSASIERWFKSRIPDDWNVRGVEILADQDEILVVVDLPSDDADAVDATHAAGREASELAGIRRFREMTRDERMAIARAAEDTFGQKVSWGARCGEVAVIFTTASVPVMTRLRLSERRVLDTLIDAGVARSRSEALAWCVRLVGEKEKEWIHELRDAFAAVEAARGKGPESRRRAGERAPGARAGADQPSAPGDDPAGEHPAGEPAAGNECATDRAAGDESAGEEAACD